MVPDCFGIYLVNVQPPFVSFIKPVKEAMKYHADHTQHFKHLQEENEPFVLDWSKMSVEAITKTKGYVKVIIVERC